MLVTELGIIIKGRRKVLGITQPDLAEIAGISTNTLYKIETGQTNPTIVIIHKIIDVLGMEMKIDVKS